MTKRTDFLFGIVIQLHSLNLFLAHNTIRKNCAEKTLGESIIDSHNEGKAVLFASTLGERSGSQMKPAGLSGLSHPPRGCMVFRGHYLICCHISSDEYT